MKTIKKIEKKKGYYLVAFNEEILRIEPDIMIKYHLSLEKEIDDHQFLEINHDNQYLYVYELAIKKLKEMMTKFEMKTYLLEKVASEAVIKRVISDLEKKKYLDDNFYLKTYISLKKHVNGPKMLAYQLKQKGIDFNLIDDAISKLDQDDEIKHLIEKKLSTLKNKSNRQKLLNLKSYLLGKGFDTSKVDFHLSKIDFPSQDDLKLIEKDYDKLKFKFKDVDPNAQKDVIFKKLYQKGYSVDLIKKVMH